MKTRTLLIILLSLLTTQLKAELATASLSMFTLHAKSIETNIYNNQVQYKSLKPGPNKNINQLNQHMKSISDQMTLRLTKIPKHTTFDTTVDIGRFFKMVSLLKPITSNLTAKEKIVVCQRINILNQFLNVINRYYYHPTDRHSDAIQQFYNNNEDTLTDLFSSGTTGAKQCKLV